MYEYYICSEINGNKIRKICKEKRNGKKKKMKINTENMMA